ncbi:transmembrane protein 196-like [Watersipora subatra]|uniref:transmembrane protein 196-like n=1 Tax=Watersipora subatra TaxID=2589382 RepID=UPI00355B417D
MWYVLVAVYILSGCHGLIAVLSICIGIASSMTADIWMAHKVSPIWSGAFFLLTAIMGVLCAQKKTVYLIMCFAAFSTVSMVVAVVNIQLLRLGLVNHMSDGDTLKKESSDPLVITALAIAGGEVLICITSGLVSLRVAKWAQKQVHKQKDGTFSITVLEGLKDIEINMTNDAGNRNKNNKTEGAGILAAESQLMLQEHAEGAIASQPL